MRRTLRGAIFLTTLLLASSSDARADWLLTPFLGTTFAGQSSLLQLDKDAVAAKHWLFGGSAAWLSDYGLGFEADVAFVPGIFEDENPFSLITASNAITLGGNVIAAVPLSVARESLRPYLIGGLGVVHAKAEDLFCLVACKALNEAALQVGGGAIGFVTDRAGLRFDLRQIRTLRRDDTLTGDTRPKLSFWRASVGAVIRY